MKNKNAIIRVSAKCSDLWSHQVIGKNGEVQSEYDGYVPSFMPGEHYGDYIMLDIDPYTGKILNWKPWKRAKASKTKS
jgi:hypothetical protein